MLHRFVVLTYLLAVGQMLFLSYAKAQDAAPLVRMLKSGRLPPERIGNVLNLVFQRGNAEDLEYLFARAADPAGFPAESRLATLDGLAIAAETRKIRPEFEPAALGKLLSTDDPKVRLAAIRLAGVWQAEALATELEQLAVDEQAPLELRRAALAALVQVGGERARGTVVQLVESPAATMRITAISVLADFDLAQAATRSAALLAKGVSGDDTASLLAPFLVRQGATDLLAAELAKLTLPPDAAKLALRHLYAAGRSDAELAAVLSAAAGMNTDPPQLDAEQLKQLAAEVWAQGDPQRGEQIFRRADLSCFKCHALSGAGGDVGPDLSPVGSTSPPDYIITSILNPDLSIKENYITRSIITDDGKIYQGIVADRDDQRVVIKEATGDKVTIPVADIVEEVEGKSLMPKGLAGFLTRQEFLDLVRFVSALGRPGDYEVRSQPTVQRWRVLPPTQAADAARTAAGRQLPESLLTAPEGDWSPAYAQVRGVLPLDELAERGSAPATGAARPEVLFLRAELEVTAAGPLEVKLEDARGISAWLDEQPLELSASSSSANVAVAPGAHKLYLRVDLPQRSSPGLRVLIEKPAGSEAAFTIVGGR